MSTDPNTPDTPPAAEPTPEAVPEAAPEAAPPAAPQEPAAPAAPGAKPDGAEKKLVAGILGILLGTLGIHKFYLGYQKEGIIMLVVALVGGTITCGVGAVAVQIIGLVEGIMYLTKSDEEFVATYITGQKGWF
jgi:TM2 domain-containing membrane protein YozV